jgi:hypothetical protein
MGLYKMDRITAKPVVSVLKNAYQNYFNFDGVLITNVDADKSINVPETFELMQNYPNPFNPSTKISWTAPIDGWQTLKLYDVLGKEISKLVDEYRKAGKYEINFNSGIDTNILTSGVYFYQLKAGNFISTKKMILIK